MFLLKSIRVQLNYIGFEHGTKFVLFILKMVLNPEIYHKFN